MTGPKFRKFSCSVCGCYRWTEDFGGVAIADLDESSVCDFCKIKELFAEEIAKVRKECGEKVEAVQENLRKAREEMERMKATCRCENSEAGPSGVNTPAGEKVKVGRRVKGEEEPERRSERKKEDRREMRAGKVGKKGNERRGKHDVEERGKEGNVKQREKEVEKKVEKRTARKLEEEAGRRKKGKNRRNKAPKKGGEKPEIFIFGDSLARDLEGMMIPRLDNSKTRVKCLPGKGVKKIREQVERVKTDHSSVIVTMVSGNDLYLRKGQVGGTEKIVKEVMGTVDDAGLKTRRRVVVGMIPRRGPSWTALSKNIAINERLADLCTAEGVFFVDPYTRFYKRNDLYQRDGVHLTLKGQAVLCNLITEAVKKSIRCVRPIMVSSKVEKGKTFAEAVSPKPSTSGNGGK